MKKTTLVTLTLLLCAALTAQTVQPIRVALLLPLQTEVMKRDKNMDRFLDFYSGALLAVYEEQKEGQPIDVYTYDVGKSAGQLTQALARPELDSVDFIIGPAYSAQVSVMANWAYVHHIYTLLPFASEIPGIETNPYVLQFNPSFDIEAAAMATQLGAKRDSVRCIFITANEADIPLSVRQLQTHIRNAGVECIYTTVHQILSDSLPFIMADDKENVLLMNTERYANLRTVMPALMRAAQGHRLTLLSRYSWLEETIALPQIFSTIFRREVDIDSYAYGDEYRRFYDIVRQTGHPCYDLLGFDLMKYILFTARGLRETADEETKDQVICRKYNGIQSDLHFKRINAEGGYQNNDIHVIHIR